MNHPLVIRADANSRIGIGHVMRCIALGQAWQDAGGRVIFVSCLDSDGVRNRIAGEGFKLVELQHANSAGNDDLQALVRISRDLNATWIVVDGYHFDLAYQQSVRRNGFKLLVVDDYSHLAEYDADILLNQNIGAEEIEYSLNPDCRKLIGLSYVMLRREFRSALKNTNSSSPIVRNVLVTMGGSDPDNATLQVINMFRQLSVSDLHIRILVGDSNRHIESLTDAIEGLSCRVEIIKLVTNMPDMIGWADFAISAAGSTCWELAALEVPFITVVLADNQERVAQLLDKTAGVKCAGRSGAGLQQRLYRQCAGILAGKSAAFQSYGTRLSGLVDVWGVYRVLSKPSGNLGVNLFGDRLVLRAVQMADAEILLGWANDEETRHGSFNSSMIPRKQHVDWLEKRLADSGCLFLLAELDGVPCGEIRYDMINPGEVLMSFTLAPTFRGMGMSSLMVDASWVAVLDQFGECVVRAYSLPDNVRAQAALAKTGFVFNDAETEYMGVPCHALTRTINMKEIS